MNVDIDARAHNRVEERDGTRGAWRPLRYETRREKRPGRRWRVMSARTKRGYELVPGPEDGQADRRFGVGDFWVVRLRPGQIDDGQGFTTIPAEARAHIDRFVNGETVDESDVVIWYAAHFAHDFRAEDSEHGHIVGPELRPVNWTA